MQKNKLFTEITGLDTEKINQDTINIDVADTFAILNMINTEDQKVAFAVKEQIPYIAKAVDMVSNAFQNGGRLFYFGAGTSGRLGVVDASECPPTFGTSADMVQGIIAGGESAMFCSQEGAEDSEKSAEEEFVKHKINSKDIVCGIAASGRTPYVIGALKSAHKRRIKTIMITTISREHTKKLELISDVLICPYVGPEVIAGSTRMKSGTAQKLVLNMLSTASMIKIGKTFGNIMVDLQLTNQKLKERAKKIIMEISNCSYERATELLELSNGKVKTALLMELADVDNLTAEKMLFNKKGAIKKALRTLKE